MIDTLHQALRSVHISVGSIGLILFWIPVFARKGSPSHRKIGQWFVCSVYVVSISALISCAWAWAWAHPASFLEQPELTAGAAKQLRFFTGILSLLAAMALSGAVLGPRVLRIKDSGRPMANLPLHLSLGIQLSASLGLLAWCVYLVTTASFQGRHMILLVLAVLTLLDHQQVRRYLRNPERVPWLHKHLEAMIGCGIAFHTAALVTIFSRVLELHLAGPLALLPWLLPTLIGLPAIHLAKRRYAPQQA